MRPGFDELGGAIGRVKTWAGHAGTGDGDDRHEFAGEQGAVARQRGEVVFVEGRALQLFDRAHEQQFLGDRFAIGANDVDLDVVAASPVAADRGLP